MIRHTEFFKTLKTKPMHVKRLAAHVVEDINDHFVDFRQCKDKWGIYDDNVSNFDELRFPISVTTSKHVIVPVDCTVVYQADPANRELVTTVETLNYMLQSHVIERLEDAMKVRGLHWSELRIAVT
jgi:hypothetical protein